MLYHLWKFYLRASDWKTCYEKENISCFCFFILRHIYQRTKENVFEKVEVDAYTNEKAWVAHVMKKTQLPDSILKDIPAGTYKINVQFIIDKHGNIGQIKAKNDPGFGLARRAEHIVSTYNGTWIPASQCGRSVKAYRTQPITFVIPSQ